MKAITIILGSALITAAAIKAVPVLAAPVAQGQLVVSTVATSDIDLSTSSGLKLLDRRLAAAAREVCGFASDADLEGKNDVRACREDILAKARSSRDAMIASRRVGATITLAAAH